MEDADLVLVGPRRLKAALALDGGEPRAREGALGLVLEAGARWQRWLAPPQTLAAELAGLTCWEFEAILADRGIERVVACDAAANLERQVESLRQ